MSTQYAGAAELVARSAAAFVAGVPENPADDGFFGPASITWRINADLSAPVAGLRSLMLQALHPLAMAGVDQHSHWRRDPVGRMAATSQYVTTITYGDRATAQASAAMVRRIHSHVLGTDTITGQDYAATDPALLLWVHAALVESALVSAERIGTPPTAGDADRYVAEMVAAAELVGVPAGMTPDDVAGLNAYLDRVRGDLRVTPAAAESLSYLLGPEGLDPEVADLWRDIASEAAASLPDWARKEYGFTEPAPDREDVRAALGMLDILYIGEPGVLEARQRIEARLRAAG
jgi:uncharacterized protein (DUF2236 family)